MPPARVAFVYAEEPNYARMNAAVLRSWELLSLLDDSSRLQYIEFGVIAYFS